MQSTSFVTFAGHKYHFSSLTCVFVFWLHGDLFLEISLSGLAVKSESSARNHHWTLHAKLPLAVADELSNGMF